MTILAWRQNSTLRQARLGTAKAAISFGNSDRGQQMSDKPRSFKEVVATQDPAERTRIENGETFNDFLPKSSFFTSIGVAGRLCR
jgi:hypothetical protein